MKSSIVLVSIPRISPAPLTGLHLMQQSLDTAGIKCDIYDANLDLYQALSSHPKWHEIEEWGIQQRLMRELDLELQHLLLERFRSWAQEIVSFDPDVVGISVFTIESRNWAQWLCYHLKELDPSIEILLGGRGINDPGTADATFAIECMNWQLCDHFLNGESEHEIVNYMQGTSQHVDGRDVFFINDDLDRRPKTVVPSEIYKKYPIVSNWYEGKDDNTHSHIESVGNPGIRTYSTRGCIKTCSFCDVHLLRPRFSMRSGKNLFEEIRNGIENHGLTTVYFSDEMINGSNKQFMSWLVLLAEYLDQNKIDGFSWRSQFGIKKRQSTPTELFDLISKTNGRLAVGVDHMSDSVLSHMGKHYTQDDIFWYLEHIHNTNIVIDPMQIVCAYPTETLEDFEILKTGIRELKNFKESIRLIDLGSLCSIPKGSVLEQLPGMEIGSTRLDWYWSGNPTLTKQEKLRRRTELDEIVESIGLVNRKKRTYWLRIQAWLTR